MAPRSLLVCLYLYLFVSLSFGQFSIQETRQSLCLYSGPGKTVLKPVQLFNTDCPNNTSYCMNAIWKYGNFQYNGISGLRPEKGEVVAFLVQSERGDVDMVTMLNANIDVTSQVHMSIVGAEPTDIILKDDPTGDTWNWDKNTNSGNFSWVTKPGYTDGVVIGHIKFIDNYCVSATYTQVSGAITKVSLMTGSTKNISKILTTPYTPGANFQFCQYPVTATVYVNATCPGRSDGSANISVVFGPDNLQFSWWNSNSVLIASTASVTGLAAGTYNIYVNDTGNSCNAARSVTIYDNTLYGASVSVTPFACVTKGTATVTPNGGSGGFIYKWFKTGSSISFASTSSVANLDQGSYFVRVTDSCGSTVDTPFTIGTTGCCGDGSCAGSETCASCAADCGKCCPAGTFIDGSGCTVCPPGTRNNAAQSKSCSQCPANTFNAGGNDTCAPCPANTYSTASSGKCMRCPAGQVRSTSAGSCSSCPAGSFAAPCDDSSCMFCSPGSISAAAGSTFCTTCPAGTFAYWNSSSCSTCAAGKYSAAGSSSCSDCPSGTSSVAGATHLLACN